jgi:hypothetical protein
MLIYVLSMLRSMTRTTQPQGTGSNNSASSAAAPADLSSKFEAISNVSVTQTPEGLITFSFYRALNGSGGAPTIDPSYLPLIWAVGLSWQVCR